MSVMETGSWGNVLGFCNPEDQGPSQVRVVSPGACLASAWQVPQDVDAANRDQGPREEPQPCLISWLDLWLSGVF